jgi:hypothetical protein
MQRSIISYSFLVRTTWIELTKKGAHSKDYGGKIKTGFCPQAQMHMVADTSWSSACSLYVQIIPNSDMCRCRRLPTS